MKTPFSYQAELRSIDPERNRFRRYVVTVAPTLTGEFIITTWRGRVGSRLSQREETFSSLREVIEHLADILHQRVGHGYRFAS